MPFVRFSRDKRGYEHVYLVHADGRGRSSEPRMLYWYRTPPGVKVGRPPFDAETQRALEAKFPDLTFDWPRLIATPKPPPPDVEHWRERRRLERAAKRGDKEEAETPIASAPQPEVASAEGAAVSTPAATSAPGTVVRRRRRRGRRRRSDAALGARPGEPHAQDGITRPEADPMAQAGDRSENEAENRPDDGPDAPSETE